MRVEALSTSGPNPLLAGIRDTLRAADRALLCVAFARPAGVNLLAPQLRRLHSSRVLVTTTFRSTDSAALRMLQELGASVRVLNPGGGSYHPKVYLGAGEDAASAVIGSANLTGGLATNIEFATRLSGRPGDAELVRTWDWAEEMWEHRSATEWVPEGEVEESTLDDELWRAIQAAVKSNDTFYTIDKQKPNVVREAVPQGLYVETEKTLREENPPQLVPAWMLQVAWDYLRARGELSNQYLLANDGLNVKRSSAVCAILSRLPGVKVKSRRPIVLILEQISER